jgi:phospholipid-binding lipoprotein MlaA
MKSFFKIFILGLFCFKAVFAEAVNLPTYSYTEMYIYDNQDETKVLPEIPSQPLISDPFEPVNRHIFNINSILDSAFISPVVETYLALTHKHVRGSLDNFMSNIGEPINFLNSMLQGDFAQARVTFGRFLANTVLGFFGIIDVASKADMQYKSEDFGQTMAHYGVGSGPYVVMPIFGPSSIRDASGKVVDFFADPLTHALDSKGRQVINVTWAFHKRSEANQIIKTVKRSLDPYETAKLLYIQNRNNQINNKN